MNGDGLGDFLIAAPFAGELGSGLVYLVLGRSGLPSEIRLDASPAAPDGVIRILGSRSYEYVGRPGPGGDFNLDGFPDILLGSAPAVAGPVPAPGNVYVIFGGPLLRDEIRLRDLGSRGLAIAGVHIAPIGVGAPHTGDLNGDGAQDIAFREDHELAEQGALASVYAIFGPVREGRFVRGDATQDGLLDITDAIFNLSYLFLGGEAPACEDAADADDTGRIELTDAVRILGYLFLGGPAPSPPHPDRDVDPTPDDLHCLGF